MNKFLKVLLVIILMLSITNFIPKKSYVEGIKDEKIYWFILDRSNNQEFLYYGFPGDQAKSELVKEFRVKTGVPRQKPTPLPQLMGRQYWLITEKRESANNPETSPYFLKLNIPVSDKEPFGPAPYLECSGQCNWELPGDFGLHGVGGNMDKLSESDPGSSGCIRHSDEDITYLYNLLDPQSQEIRYYIKS